MCVCAIQHASLCADPISSGIVQAVTPTHSVHCIHMYLHVCTWQLCGYCVTSSAKNNYYQVCDFSTQIILPTKLIHVHVVAEPMQLFRYMYMYMGVPVLLCLQLLFV